MSLPRPMHRVGSIVLYVIMPSTVGARARVVVRISPMLGCGRLTYGALFVEGLDPAERRLRAEAERRGVSWSSLVLQASAAASARRRGVKGGSDTPPTSSPRASKARPTGFFPGS